MDRCLKTTLLQLFILWHFVTKAFAVKTITATLSLSGTITTGTGTNTASYVFQTPSMLPHLSDLPIPNSIPPPKSILWQPFLLVLLIPISLIVLCVLQIKWKIKRFNASDGSSEHRGVAGPISASAQDSTTQITTDFFVRPQNIQTFRSWVSKVNASTPEMATIISRKWLVDGEPLLEPLGGLLMGFKNYFIDLRTRGQLAPAIDWAMAGTRKYDEKNDKILLVDLILDSLKNRGEPEATFPIAHFLPRPKLADINFIQRVRIQSTNGQTMDYEEIWARKLPVLIPGEDLQHIHAWILESDNVEGEKKIFLGKIGGDYLAISETKADNTRVGEFDARWEKWSAKSSSWEVQFRERENDQLPSLVSDAGVFDGQDSWYEGGNVKILGRNYTVRAYQF